MLWYEEIQQTIDMANAHNAEAVDRELHLVDLIIKDKQLTAWLIINKFNGYKNLIAKF